MSENLEFYTNLGGALSLGDEQFEKLLKALGEAAQVPDPKDKILELVSSDFGLSGDELEAAADAGISYYSTDFELHEADEKSEKLAKMAFESRKNTSPDLTGEQFHTRLVSIITAFSPLARSNQIRAVMLHDERVFSSSSITPQLRPLFTDDTETEIDSFVAVFNWKMKLYRNNEYENIHVSLDLNDIENLIDSLEVAREQIELINSRISKGGFEIITSF